VGFYKRNAKQKQGSLNGLFNRYLHRAVLKFKVLKLF